MSAGPESGSPPPPSPQLLGQLLLERGLLSEEQLATALAQQQQTGAQLGETLAELGYVPAGLIAQALATQHGGLLKTEYGFATGFGLGRPSAPVAEPPTLPPPNPLRVARLTSALSAHTAERPASPAPPRAVPAAEADVLRQELESLRSRFAESKQERDAARAEAAKALQRVQELERELDLAVAAAAPAADETSRAGQPASAPDELWTRLEELDARLEEAGESAAALERARDLLAEENEKLASRLDERARRCEELEAELATARQEAEEAVEPPVDRHLAFVGTSAGYSIVEIEGPPPPVDTIVELPEASGVGGRQRVVRVGRANMPGVDHPCVHLLSVD